MPHAVAPAAKGYQQDALSPLNKVKPKTSLTPQLPTPAPLPESPDPSPGGEEEGGEGQERARDTNEQPSIGVVEREKAVPTTALFAQKEVSPAPPSPDYTSIFHRSLDLLDRKFDTTPEGRREAKALMTELELLNPKPAAVMKKESQTPPVPSLPNVPVTLKTALPELPSARTQPATHEPAFCSSGRPAEASLSGEGGRPEAFSALPIAAPSKPAGGFVTPAYPACRRKGEPRRASRPPESQFPPPRPKRQAPVVRESEQPSTGVVEPKKASGRERHANQELRGPKEVITAFFRHEKGHSADWYAPAAWSGSRPDPFPSRQEKLKRKLPTMSDRRLQHQMQSRAFWH